MNMKSSYSNSALILGAMAFIIFKPMLTMGQTTNQTATPTRRLKIAIPVRGFDDFVRVSSDLTTGEQNFSGFAVDVFKAVAFTALPNPIPFDFIPFAKPDGTMNGTFDDMLKAVFNQEYDGAVGDISIVYYRSDWVDFTLPYMDTGISMLVPLKQTKITGVPLVRVTKGFVAATLAFSFLVAFVFWILEHKNDKHASQPCLASNDDYWRREMLASIVQTRLTTVLLFMVLLVFIACYSASQTSSFTTQRQRVPFKNLNQLIRMGAKVGYQKGSFINNLLLQKGLVESQLVAFNSEQEMFDILSKGTAQGGVSAVVGLTPHLKLLQAQRCDAFTLVPTFNLHAAGFGFAFQKGAPFIRDFSNGILKVIYNGQLGRIQDRTIGSLETCQDSDDQNGAASAHLLDSDTLWILIAGAIGVLLLMIIVLMLQCGGACNRNTRKKKATAYPCYLLPCC